MMKLEKNDSQAKLKTQKVTSNNAFCALYFS